ncbi:MAG: DUF2723 domain-containing protein, partial [Gemmatimonadetes bacterium]|nr:DUF2723 domain-containing protein [Gemmatimonadota bacterium]
MRNVWIAAVLVFGAAALLYGTTAAPDVGLVDSGELSLAAATGGVAHPPGVPLWLLAGRVFATLPVAGGAARALNLMSAFWMAAAVGALVIAAERLLAFLGSAPGGSRKADSRSEVGESRPRLIAAVGAGVMFAVAYNPWTWSSVAEVYALNTFLAATTWAFAWDAAVRLRSTPASAPAPAAAWRSVTGASIAASLGLANHHATAALAFPVLLVLVALVRPTLYRTRRFWVTTVSAVVGSLALYLYLFVAARHDPALNWGGIDSFELLLRHLRGAQYAQQVGSSPEEMKRVAGDFFLTLVNGGGWIAAALVAFGLFRLATGSKRDRGTGHAAAVVLIAAIALNLLLSVNYVAGPEDRVAYDLPATLAWFLAAAVGVHALAGRARFGAPVAIVACLAGVAFSVIRNGPLCDLRSDRTARTFVVEALGELPPGAVVLTAEWNLYAPYLYLRHVEGWRPDLRVIDVLMLRRHWYLAYLAREYPDLCEATRVPF